MKNILIVISLFTSFTLFAQQKGASPLNPKSEIANPKSTTRAVVIGISDYQDEKIPDLRFADKDAEAFANFLRSPAGGSLDNYHMKVLLNEEATMAQFGMSLYWLMEETQEGDKVIIYFSGHGDVEKKSFAQPGFWLCWDAPPKAYLIGGAFPLLLLQDVVQTLSLGNKAEVVVIADACRAGKLSGSSINGAQITGANLTRLLINDIKLLSCQPNEYSIEGEQWGGGRGAFSYHLVNGLYGLADRNKDLVVTLSEIDRYLEDHVTPEVEPISQVPVVYGNKTAKLAVVDANILADITSEQPNRTGSFFAIESKGLEEQVLEGVDTSIRKMYEDFQQALKDRVFLKPAEGHIGDASAPVDWCADAYYRKLIQEPGLLHLHSTMHRNYAAALMESTQQFMNGLFKSDVNYCPTAGSVREKGLKENIAYLDRAVELLGEGHYMYNTLQSFKYFFEGVVSNFHLNDIDIDTVKGQKTIDLYKTALSYQSDLPQVWVEMANTYGNKMHQFDSAFHYAQLALDAVPGWVYAHVTMARILKSKSDDEAAWQWAEKAWQLDSTSLLTISFYGNFYRERQEGDLAMKYFEMASNRGTPVFCDYIWLGNFYKDKGQFDEAERMFKKALALDVANDFAQHNLAGIYLETRQYDKVEEILLPIVTSGTEIVRAYVNLFKTYVYTNRPEDAIKVFEKIIAQNFILGWWGLPPRVYSMEFCVSYLYAFGPKRAEQAFNKSISLDSTHAGAYLALGNVYLLTQRKTEAEHQFEKALAIEPENLLLHDNIATLHSRLGHWEKALGYYERALKIDPNDVKSIEFKAWHLIFLHRYEEALKTCEKSLEIAPDEQTILSVYGAAHMQILSYDKAEEILKKALTKGNDVNDEIQIMLGFLYHRTKRYQEAEDMLKQALRWDKPLVYLIGIGTLMRSRKHYSEWEEVLNLMQELAPTNPNVYLEQSRLFAITEQYDSALKSLELVLKNGYRDTAYLPYDISLAPLREQRAQQWQALMKKYFPDQFKN